MIGQGRFDRRQQHAATPILIFLDFADARDADRRLAPGADLRLVARDMSSQDVPRDPRRRHVGHRRARGGVSP
jgi:hypothetical protein